MQGRGELFEKGSPLPCTPPLLKTFDKGGKKR
jgi:hypothetical protein